MALEDDPPPGEKGFATRRQGGAEEHTSKRVEHGPNHENEKLLGIFGGDAGLQTMSMRVNLTKAKGLSKGHDTP